MLLTVNGRVRAGTDPTLRYTAGGVPVCSVRAVASRNRKTDSGEWETVREMWFEVVAWRGLAELLGENVVKGQEFYLLGEIFEEEYDTRDGNKAKAVKVDALALYPIPRRDAPASPTAPATGSGDPWGSPTPPGPGYGQGDEPPF